ncbi:MAG: hypothetical protein DRR19_30345, partial [Candidatus Parabeggiatoa sp. nov. 1]
GSDDQTVRLWDVETRENLLTLFHGSNGEWVAWTPSGHYAASPNGDKMVGWQINRGVDKAADYVKAAQLRDSLYRPDVIDATLRLRSVKQAIAQTKKAHFNLARLQQESPPRFQITSPRGNSKVTKGVVPVVLKIATNTQAIQSFSVYVNGRKVTPQGVRNIPRLIKSHQRTLEVPLETGKNRIKIRAKNRLGTTSAAVTVHYDGTSQIREGTLHLVSIGVSAYPNLPSDKQLGFAAKDAQALHNTLATQAKKRYRKVNPVLLSDNQGNSPTKDNIKAALANLKAKPADTTIVFLAGHGVNLGKDYYFVPRDARYSGGKIVADSLVPWQVLQNAIANAQGRRILLIDTCHAGNAFNPRLLQDAANKNVVVLSATDADSISRERKELGHGVFTYALLEGLKGCADMLPDGGKIMFKELDTYVSHLVSQITENRQRTVSQASGQGFEDFVFVQL